MSAQRNKGGCVVQVWFETESESHHGKARFQIIETELPDFATFCEMVDGDRLIGGAVLRTRRMNDGGNEIINRRPTAFRGCAVVRCELPEWEFFESETA